jgi:hypothetical protein
MTSAFTLQSIQSWSPKCLMFEGKRNSEDKSVHLHLHVAY